MTVHVIGLRKFARGLTSASLAASLTLLAATPAMAQDQREEPDAMDVARTPLEDFNIDSDEIPLVLINARDRTYDDTGLIGCNHIEAEIAALKAVLGDDFDQPLDEESRMSVGRVAQSVVGSFIPFRGIVREVSGANKKRREWQQAVMAGMVRRGYLKGMGEQRGCEYPARPLPVTDDSYVERLDARGDQ
jgi:hypothetical protein